MKFLMEMVEGASHCIGTLWELQEMRFESIFDNMTWVAISIVTAAFSYFMAARALFIVPL
ncbi:hypothetical protein LINPERPRIM_LOCUS25542 [Linum perenne]